MADAGYTDSTFYQTTMQPTNWYKWFTKDESKDDDGWTQVCNNLFITVIVSISGCRPRHGPGFRLG